MHLTKFLFLGGLFLGTADAVPAQSTIDPVKEHSAWSANAGWLLWYPSAADGAVIGQYICSGAVYAANLGWISLGNGAPGSAGHYANTDGADAGVNVAMEPDGLTAKLRGLAWSANAGWIVFEGNGDPRVNLNTGKLTGSLWGANLGWISLENLGGNYGPRTLCLANGTDTDGDGLPDAWEVDQAGSLIVLGGASDPDHDGGQAFEEFLFGTNPLDPLSLPEIVSITGLESPLATVTFGSSPQRRYHLEKSTDLVLWSEVVAAAPAPGPFTTVHFVPPDGPRYFFRIRAHYPLPKP